jgi:CxxC motif-containing protein (DUF1111 family)
MKTARPFLAWTLVACLVLAGAVGSSVAGMASRSQLGRPLEGLNMQERKLFRDGKEAFGTTEAASDGLGPIFNNNSCVACHFAPVIGGSSPINETRAQRVDPSGAHFEFDGGSLFQSDAISPNCKELVPPGANATAMRQTTPLFGLGLVEAIPDEQLEGYAADEARSFPQQAGRVNRVTDVASGLSRVGRFGWKDQQATLLAFSGDAYLNEMGITSHLFPTENAPNGDLGKLAACDTVKDPEDTDDDVAAFANFMRLLAPPSGDDGCSRADHHHKFSRGRRLFARSDRGAELFEKIGCAVCHHAGFTASSPIAAIDGETVDAYSDFLLHDVGTGDGIVQGGAEANELRTAPLWGLSESAPYLHDGSAPTIQEAIRRHANQGAAAQQAFRGLSGADQQALVAFLGSL